jgi:hypothetical protein
MISSLPAGDSAIKTVAPLPQIHVERTHLARRRVESAPNDVATLPLGGPGNGGFVPHPGEIPLDLSLQIRRG